MKSNKGTDTSSGARQAPEVIDFGKRVVAMKHPAVSQVEAYWEGLRGARTAPLRSEVDPRGIDRALEHAFILERIAPGLARFRLAGMHLNELMGMEVRGMPLTSFFTPDARQAVTEALGHVFEQPAKAEFELQGERGSGGLPGQMILLPLRSDLGDVSRALGCLVTHGQIRRSPQRFEIVHSWLVPLVPGEAGPRAVPYARPEPAAGSLAEPRRAYQNRPAPGAATTTGTGSTGTPSAGRPGSGRGAHLRLISDNENKG